MAHVTVPTPGETYTAPVDRSRRNYQHVRVLRWIFRRDDQDEAVVCELALTGDDRAYELRAPALWNPTGASVEQLMMPSRRSSGDDRADAPGRRLAFDDFESEGDAA
jgi:hypothetical protein